MLSSLRGCERWGQYCMVKCDYFRQHSLWPAELLTACRPYGAVGDCCPGFLMQGRGEGRLIRRRRWQEKVRVRREAARQQRAADKAAVRVSAWHVHGSGADAPHSG